jgi:hypothetical protein
MNLGKRTAHVVGLLLILAGVGCARAQDAPASDVQYAQQLLRRAGLPPDSAGIQRVLRDSFETVVWVEPRLRGLPVFQRQVGYVFDRGGHRETDPTTGRPMMLGDAPPDESAAPDPEPRVSADSATAMYLARLRQQQSAISPGVPDSVDAVLGYAGAATSDRLRLVWRVRPRGRAAPEAFIDAGGGDVVHYDSGIRCVRAPCP